MLHFTRADRQGSAAISLQRFHSPPLSLCGPASQTEYVFSHISATNFSRRRIRHFTDQGARVTATALLTFTPVAAASPDTGSASGSAGYGPRSSADRLFLDKSFFDDESCDLQDSAISLAHASCDRLDATGGSTRDQIRLAEDLSDTLDYPYTFVDAAIRAYCPQHDH